MPVAGRLPFEWIYPTGEKQEKRTPKWGKYYEWATVIAGDCHYIKRFMPDNLQGKVIVTNTTTPEDVEAFRKAGREIFDYYHACSGWTLIRYEYDGGRAGGCLWQGTPAHLAELSEMLDKLGFEPQLQELN